MARHALLFLLALAGCGEDEPPCVAPDLACQPLYEPTFDELYTRTLAPSCAVSGGACHSAAGAKGGLSFEDADAAYEHLVGEGRVVAGDASCSLVARRVGATERRWQMPPGDPLPAAEQCVIYQWIADGAER